MAVAFPVPKPVPVQFSASAIDFSLKKHWISDEKKVFRRKIRNAQEKNITVQEILKHCIINKFLTVFYSFLVKKHSE